MELTIHLYTTFYKETKELRNQELLLCIEKNLLNRMINSVTIFNEGGDLGSFRSDKLKIIDVSKRPTYQDFITYINKISKPEDIHIIANTDIYFEEHIGVLRHLYLKDKCLALSRWDTTNVKTPKLYNHNDSQDVWIFEGNIKTELQADFPLGVPRCDNRLLYELEKVGYQVLNPAFSIKCYHLHEGQRAMVYTEDDNVYNIAPPYRYKYPHNCFGFFVTLYFNYTHKQKLGLYRYDIKKINRWWLIRLIRKILELIIRKKPPMIGYR